MNGSCLTYSGFQVLCALFDVKTSDAATFDIFSNENILGHHCTINVLDSLTEEDAYRNYWDGRDPSITEFYDDNTNEVIGTTSSNNTPRSPTTYLPNEDLPDTPVLPPISPPPPPTPSPPATPPTLSTLPPTPPPASPILPPPAAPASSNKRPAPESGAPAVAPLTKRQKKNRAKKLKRKVARPITAPTVPVSPGTAYGNIQSTLDLAAKNLSSAYSIDDTLRELEQIGADLGGAPTGWTPLNQFDFHM